MPVHAEQQIPKGCATDTQLTHPHPALHPTCPLQVTMPNFLFIWPRRLTTRLLALTGRSPKPVSLTRCLCTIPYPFSSSTKSAPSNKLPALAIFSILAERRLPSSQNNLLVESLNFPAQIPRIGRKSLLASVTVSVYPQFLKHAHKEGPAAEHDELP